MRKRYFRYGITLVELLVVIAVLAILITIATPSFTETIRSNQVAAQNNELIALLHLGRNEAIRRNPQGALINDRTVRVQLTPDGSSWEGIVRPPGDLETAPGCPTGAIRCSENRRVALTGDTQPDGSILIRFDNRGYSVASGGELSQVMLQLSHEQATSPRHQRCITLFPGGQAQSTDGDC